MEIRDEYTNQFAEIYIESDYGKLEFAFDKQNLELLHKSHVVSKIETLLNALNKQQKLFAYGGHYAHETRDLLPYMIENYLKDVKQIMDRIEQRNEAI